MKTMKGAVNTRRALCEVFMFSEDEKKWIKQPDEYRNVPVEGWSGQKTIRTNSGAEFISEIGFRLS
jgi:hypothetical protein